MHPPPSSFTADLARLNGLDLLRWILEEGMGYRAAGAWWGARRPRPRPHNGLDLHRFESGAGTRETLAPGALVPIAWAGRIVRVVDDFLGQSLFADHGEVAGGGRLLTACGHVRPLPGAAAGALFPAGTAIAALAAPARGPVPAHLHLSALVVPASFPPERLAWETLDDDRDVTWLDPTPILGAPGERALPSRQGAAQTTPGVTASARGGRAGG